MKQLKNLLSKESSPYLLQHANNPVAWQSWDDSILKYAKDNNKLLLISIGYSACHWCHVMEHECFEDQEVASIMNENFINIKVDREERPDVDHIYMNALQIMTGQGGWPLNIVALPDGRPIWGATYLPKKKWMGSLLQLKDLYIKAPEHMIDYAEKLSDGMHQINNLIDTDQDSSTFTSEYLKEVLNVWQTKFDLENGGFKGAPKFMMPNNLSFLLRYGFQLKEKQVLDFVENSLIKMAQGGIYDVLGGGFSRYSVDERWHIPHFEKMLYDNAQLIELYSDAYSIFKNELFKNVVKDSIAFIKRELTAPEGYFYSALDADSLDHDHKKKEGAFYVWTKTELQRLLKEDFEVFANYFNINEFGYWEDQNYVLIQTKTPQEVASQFSITENELKTRISQCKEILFKERKKRQRPSLDDKCLTSWNAMMIKAYAKAYQVFQIDEYLIAGENAVKFIIKNLLDEFQLYRNFKNKKTITATLEDYAFLIDALIEIYQTTRKISYLTLAKNLTERVIDKFYDTKSKLFFYTSAEVKLIQRTIETQDNVIPSSNSVMAHNLFKLSKYFLIPEWEDKAVNMLQRIKPQIENYISGHSNWLSLYLNYSEPFYELVYTVVDEDDINKIQQSYLPQIILSSTENNLPLTNGKQAEQKLYYVCKKGSCRAPENNIETVLKSING